MPQPRLAVQARTEFGSALNQLCTERGVNPEVVIESIRAAIATAYVKDHTDIEETDIRVELDHSTGEANLFDKKNKNITPSNFGRFAAQTAKQVIFQRIREAEKDAILTEYSGKVDSMISGQILRIEGPNVFVDIGRGQGFFPRSHQVASEYYHPNQRLKFIITEISDTPHGKRVIVSRNDPRLVEELFKLEVPEIQAGSVKITNIAREAGNRTKLTVFSDEQGVDPIGSCVGQKGVRVQAVIEELMGEKVDIIQATDKIDDFIKAALSPAEKLTLKINEKDKTVTVTAPEDQLSLAIGKGGQNVRLASKLTGYQIDIRGSQTKPKDSSSDSKDSPKVDKKDSPKVDKKDSPEITKDKSEKKKKKVKKTKA